MNSNRTCSKITCSFLVSLFEKYRTSLSFSAWLMKKSSIISITLCTSKMENSRSVFSIVLISSVTTYTSWIPARDLSNMKKCIYFCKMLDFRNEKSWKEKLSFASLLGNLWEKSPMPINGKCQIEKGEKSSWNRENRAERNGIPSRILAYVVPLFNLKDIYWRWNFGALSRT